jgi:hypothetical protein
MEKKIMPVSTKIMSWFRKDPLPLFISDPLLVFGGTNLISMFIESLAINGDSGELGITVPFVDSGFIMACPAWRELNHSNIDLFVVSKRESDVEAAKTQFSLFPWRSLRIARLRVLHAKVFTFVGANGTSMALVGSHNLTAAAAQNNYEAGVFLSTLNSGETAVTISDLHDQSRSVLKTSSQRYDSNCWPDHTIN